MTDVIEGTATEAGTELVHQPPPQQPTTLFRTDDPIEVVERASRVADALKAVLSKQGMVQMIQGREHVKVEGWTTLGSMLGVVPVVEWSRPVEGTDSPAGHDWEARVEARTLDGRVIGAAEATCSRKERTWSRRDDYALRSMAQTRATSKALRGPLGFVVTLAGFEATPAEEMPRGEAPARSDIPSDLSWEQGPEGAAPDPVTDPPAEPLIDENYACDIHADFKRRGLRLGHFRDILTSAGVQYPDDLASAEKRIAFLKTLTVDEGVRVGQALQAHVKAAA